MPNVLSVKNNEPAQPVLSIEKEISYKDLEDSEEPPTPTNCEPAIEAIAVASSDVRPLTSSDSGSIQANIADDITSSESDSEEANTESNIDATSGFDTDSEPDSSETPYEALNRYVALPSVVVEEEDEEPVVLTVPLAQSDEESSAQPPHPQLAIQENFDLSPSSEKVDLPEKLSTVMTRTFSDDSVESSKLALSETEFSDWAGNSLRGDLDVELNIDPEPTKQIISKESSKIINLKEKASANVTLNNGTSNFDDIEYADNSEEQELDLNGYTPLVEELPTPDKPDTPLV